MERKKFLSIFEISPEPPDLLADLRSAPIANIIAAQNAVFGEWDPGVRWAWQPVIDNVIVSRIPLEGWRSGDYHSVLILTGFNHNEGGRDVPRFMSTSQ